MGGLPWATRFFFFFNFGEGWDNFCVDDDEDDVEWGEVSVRPRAAKSLATTILVGSHSDQNACLLIQWSCVRISLRRSLLKKIASASRSTRVVLLK